MSRKRPVRHNRTNYTRKDGTPVKETIVNPDVHRSPTPKSQKKKLTIAEAKRLYEKQKQQERRKLEFYNESNLGELEKKVLSLILKEGKLTSGEIKKKLNLKYYPSNQLNNLYRKGIITYQNVGNKYYNLIDPKYKPPIKNKRYKELEKFTKAQLLEIVKSDTELYKRSTWLDPKYWHKDEMIRDMLEDEKIEQKKMKIERGSIKQSWDVLDPIMEKELEPNIVQSLKALSKNPREYSIGLDFERKLRLPQTIVEVKGGEKQTIKFDDFEMFGHTHPDRVNANPSAADLRNLEMLRPEFIIAGKSGDMILLNIEDPQVYQKWRKKSEGLPKYSRALSEEDIKKYGENLLQQERMGKLLKYKKGRDVFYKETGVKIYPYKKGMKIEMIDDPNFEKKVPTIPATAEYYRPEKKEQKRS